MRHFADEDWSDLARGLMAKARKASMLRHLDEGCERCAGYYRTWRSVNECATRGVSYQPPEGVVRSVKALYALHKPKSASTRSVKIARLIFDSFRQSVPVEVRGMTQSIRQVLYKAGGYYVDLRIEHKTETSQASVVGQILRHPGARPDTGQLSVALSRGDTPLEHTVTNQFGEFHLEFDASKNHDLSITIDKVSSVMVPLHKSHK